MSLKNAALLSLALALAAAISGCGSRAAVPAAGTPAALGQRIFTTGNGVDGTPLATSSGQGGPCARCHGDNAQGKVGPDIRWSVLTGSAASSHAPRFHLATEADFTQVVTAGNAVGNALRPIMPHYNLTSTEVAGLVAYLKTL